MMLSVAEVPRLPTMMRGSEKLYFRKVGTQVLGESAVRL
jgi:hypothetical protein